MDQRRGSRTLREEVRDVGKSTPKPINKPTKSLPEKLEKSLALINQLSSSITLYKLAKLKRCYDLMPTSSKLVVFDTQLHVQKAFHALVYNNVRAAPLWDNDKQKFVGMLTITDFIRILICYYKSEMQQLEEQRIGKWREVLMYRDKFVTISPDATVFDAVKMLLESKIHRLPVVNPTTGDVLCILTHKRLLKYLYLSDAARPQYMEKSIGQLGIGSLSNVVTVHPDTSVITALKLFIEHTVSAFPVVDRTSGQCVDIYSKFDVIHLAADRSYDNLDISIKKALERRKQNQTIPIDPENPSDSPNSADSYSVFECKLSDSLNRVVDTIAKAEVHRLVIVDEGKKVIGVISLSDILDYLILKHPETRTPKENSVHGSSSSLDSMDLGVSHRL